MPIGTDEESIAVHVSCNSPVNNWRTETPLTFYFSAENVNGPALSMASIKEAP